MPIRTLSSDIQYYPDVIENEVQLPRVYDGITKISANTINRLRDAILRIEEELGVNPSGSYPTVSERLDALQSSVGGDLTEIENRIFYLETQVSALSDNLGDFKGGYDNLSDRLSAITDAIGDPVLQLVAGENLEEGHLVRITNNGKVRKVNCNNSDPDFARTIGSAYSSVLQNAVVRIYSTVGTLIKVKFSSPPAQVDNGRPVYISTNNGEGTLELSSLSSGSIVFMVGILQGANGIDLAPKVVFQPNLIASLE